ncbi:hypothetical protein GCM10007927_01980 [Sulfitobacter pacificus]|uniref:YD repeat-containing protein n=2 Tax=Sulfitobacter pacificus TaxID=1499314 RepID=A0ABQ5VD36_9RHOB|nr:hypothetical protein GCM10007927_01980 [Sulfitobacter pacificus]
MIKSMLGSILLAAVCAAPVSAQDIRWQPQTMTPGDYLSIDQSMGGPIHHVFAGRSGKAYVLKSYRGPSPDGTPVFTTFLDRHGNYLRWVRADGMMIDYRPHDCKRTAGECQYRRVFSDGRHEIRTRVTTPTANGFTFKEYDASGNFIFGGSIELDERGNAGDGHMNGNQGEQVYRVMKRFYQ